MDLANTWRSTNAGTSLQTNFGSIPYNNGVTGRLSENKLSAANSRTGFHVDAKAFSTNIMGYYEGDFVGGVGDTHCNTQGSSNSLIYHICLYWVDLHKDKLEFLVGQSWSMLTPNRKQISALPARGASGQTLINRQGATFPDPMYTKWFSEYKKLHSDVQINYTPTGSEAGLN
jgi:hypothetical protein